MAGRASYTYADLSMFPDDGLRREIIDGELVVTSAPYLRHQRLVGRLAVAFANHLEAHGGGEVFFAPVDVIFDEINVVEPDILFVAADRLQILTEKNVQGAPSLAIEVVSDSRMDRVRKRDLYATFGVPEYWVVDPDIDRVEVHRLAGEKYGKPELFVAPETLTYDRLPGLTIDLAALFAR